MFGPPLRACVVCPAAHGPRPMSRASLHITAWACRKQALHHRRFCLQARRGVAAGRLADGRAGRRRAGGVGGGQGGGGRGQDGAHLLRALRQSGRVQGRGWWVSGEFLLPAARIAVRRRAEGPAHGLDSLRCGTGEGRPGVAHLAGRRCKARLQAFFGIPSWSASCKQHKTSMQATGLMLRFGLAACKPWP